MKKLVSLLEQLVAIDSSQQNENTIIYYLETYCRAIGCKVSLQKVNDSRSNLFITRGEGQQALLFYGHVDTVQVHDENAWISSPYSLTSKGDTFVGLGSYDMKAGIAAILTAIEQSKGYVKAFFAIDEEGISEGAWTAVRKNKQFFTDVSLIISAEPSFSFGIAGITTKRTGRCIFQYKREGKGVHIAEYKTGIDAISMLSEDIVRLYKQRDMLFKKYGIVVQIRKIDGEANGMSVAHSASAEIEVLLSTHITIPKVKDILEKIVKNTVSLTPRKTPYLEAYSFSTIPYQESLKKIIYTITGKQMTIHERNSVGDDNVLATLGIPVITWGPEGGNAHTANEYVTKKSLEQLSTMYAHCIDSLQQEQNIG